MQRHFEHFHQGTFVSSNTCARWLLPPSRKATSLQTRSPNPGALAQKVGALPRRLGQQPADLIAKGQFTLQLKSFEFLAS